MTSEVIIPTWKKVLRWIAVIPGSIAGSLIAYWLSRLMWAWSNYIGMYGYVFDIFGEVINSGVMAAAFVYCAAYIAPNNKIATSITFAAIATLLAGASAYSSVITHEWFIILYSASMVVGSIATAVNVVGENLYNEGI